VRHIGLSDVPAWYASRGQTLAEAHRMEPIAALQLEYSLVSRSLEREHLGLAHECGISLVPWSPLASGFLTGKYRREGGTIAGSGRVAQTKDSGNPVLEKFAKSPRYWDILDVVLAAAKEMGKTPTEVSLAWVLSRPQVTSVLVGATKREQLEANLNTLDVTLPPEVERRLTEISRPESTELDHFFEPTMQAMVHGGVNVRR